MTAERQTSRATKGEYSDGVELTDGVRTTLLVISSSSVSIDRLKIVNEGYMKCQMRRVDTGEGLKLLITLSMRL